MQTKKPILNTIAGEKTSGVPFWLMRQAGRYLPEYREVREKAGGFLDLVFQPDLAAEVTIQPLRRFGMDAAILFSDILVIPLALGQDVRFEPGEGPVLEPIRSKEDLNRLSTGKAHKTLAPIYETIRNVRSGLAAEGFDDTALIGFAGAPWTVACYMVEGGSSKDFFHIKRWAYQDPESFARLIDLVTDATIDYLLHQIESGAEIIKIFDSWAGILDEKMFQRWVIEPAQKITAALKAAHPQIPVIGFPRAAGYLYQRYARETGIAVMAIDPQVPLEVAAKELQPLCCLQGNLDPLCLLAGGELLESRTKEILDTLGGKPFIFNLGHGVHKDTPPEHVARLAEIIKSWR